MTISKLSAYMTCLVAIATSLSSKNVKRTSYHENLSLQIDKPIYCLGDQQLMSYFQEHSSQDVGATLSLWFRVW